MIVVIPDGQEQVLDSLPDNSCALIIVIPAFYDLSAVQRIGKKANAKLLPGGNVIVAQSLPDAMVKL